MAGRARHVPVPIQQMAPEQIVGALTRTRNMFIREFNDGGLDLAALNDKLQEIGLPEYGKGKTSVVVIRVAIEHDPDERPGIDRVESVVNDAFSGLAEFQESDDAWSVEEDGLLGVTWEAPN